MNTYGIDNVDFSPLGSGEAVQVRLPRAPYYRRMVKLCNELSRQFGHPMTWERVESGSHQILITITPCNTRYPDVLDDDLKKFRFAVDIYKSSGAIGYTFEERRIYGPSLESLFWRINMALKSMRPGQKYRIRPGRVALSYFGGAQRFVDEMIDVFENDSNYAYAPVHATFEVVNNDRHLIVTAHEDERPSPKPIDPVVMQMLIEKMISGNVPIVA